MLAKLCSCEYFWEAFIWFFERFVFFTTLTVIVIHPELQFVIRNSPLLPTKVFCSLLQATVLASKLVYNPATFNFLCNVLALASATRIWNSTRNPFDNIDMSFLAHGKKFPDLPWSWYTVSLTFPYTVCWQPSSFSNFLCAMTADAGIPNFVTRSLILFHLGTLSDQVKKKMKMGFYANFTCTSYGKWQKKCWIQVLGQYGGECLSHGALLPAVASWVSARGSQRVVSESLRLSLVRNLTSLLSHSD